ncbi:hypothetical protein Acr_07g0010740 [Actinidia rufa]|uniref:Uncharacterized protein n=1 Tax=Actinidia rufa TaxID=165716 RepID=A0A7J0EWV6_9ERIC|nr:hypothetical protein Acr_07g0010740 [Actinidia rufa]
MGSVTKGLLALGLEIWASNQQSILLDLDLLSTRHRTIKGRPAQTNRNKGLGQGRSKPLRRDHQTKAMTADRILVEMESLEMEMLSTLPRPRARRRQYFNSDQLMSILIMALASSVETAWRGSMGSSYLGQEGSEIAFGILMWRWNFIGLMSGDVLLSPLGRGGTHMSFFSGFKVFCVLLHEEMKNKHLLAQIHGGLNEIMASKVGTMSMDIE